MKTKLFILITLSLAFEVYAGSATWNLDPVDNDWSNAANWTPQTVPSRTGDVATLGVSNTTDIGLRRWADFATLVFTPGASAYTITASERAYLGLRARGIVNDSGVTQNFVLIDKGGLYDPLFVAGTASLGENTIFTTKLISTGDAGFECFFIENSSAGGATIFVRGANHPGGTYGTRFYFFHNSRGGHSHFITDGGDVGQADGGFVYFTDTANAESATLTNNPGKVAGAIGGYTIFANDSNASNATLIANGSQNGGLPGLILFLVDALGGNARVQLQSHGRLDISGHNAPGVSIGSLNGDGVVWLGVNNLTVGGTNRDMLFNGTIEDGLFGEGGSLTKVGTGKLVLGGANTYNGATTVSSGQLWVNNKRGSGTGGGAVVVNAGRLGGTGVIDGTVEVGTGIGAGALISPGRNALSVGTLTIQQALSFRTDGRYEFGVDNDSATADQLIANGVTIDSYAQFITSFSGSAQLETGTIFTAISNTSTSPISGAFGNLADKGKIIIGNNKFQANYEGGDGNDLTLTVVP